MADFLTIDGAAYAVLDNGSAAETEPDMVGEEKRAIDGTLRSNVRVAGRNFRFTLEPMADATYQALFAKHAGFYLCGGAGLIAGTYRVSVGGGAFVNDAATLTFKRAAEVQLRSVGP